MMWLLQDGAVTPINGPDDGTATVVLAGEDIALHRVQWPDTDDRTTLETLAADLVASPIDAVHLAPDIPDADGARWLAVIDRARMAEHLHTLQAEGITPARMVPAALLLPAGTAADLDGLTLVHTTEVAGAFTPALAAALPGCAALPVVPFPPDASPDTALNLLQGSFAPRVRWWRLPRFRRMSAALLLLAAVLFATPAGIDGWRNRAATRAENAKIMALASNALPGEHFADPDTAARALTTARASRERGLIGPALTFVARRLEKTPGARVGAVTLTNGRLALAFEGPTPAINTLRQRLETGPFTVQATGAAALFTGRRNASDADANAAIIRATPAPAYVPSAAIAATLEDAGLTDALIDERRIAIPAARPTVLLPALVALEQRGLRFERLTILPNTDETVRLDATLRSRP